jgi:hypothetical protein
LKWGRELLLAALLIKIEEGIKPVDVVRHAPTKSRGRFSQFHPPKERSDVRHARSKHRKDVFRFFTTPHRLLLLSIVVVLTFDPRATSNAAESRTNNIAFMKIIDHNH